MLKFPPVNSSHDIPPGLSKSLKLANVRTDFFLPNTRVGNTLESGGLSQPRFIRAFLLMKELGKNFLEIHETNLEGQDKTYFVTLRNLERALSQGTPPQLLDPVSQWGVSRVDGPWAPKLNLLQGIFKMWKENIEGVFVDLGRPALRVLVTQEDLREYFDEATGWSASEGLCLVDVAEFVSKKK